MTIDDIFAALPDEPAQDSHEFLVIDPTTRTIQVPASESIFGVEGDEDGERKYFISPRYVGDNLDLAACFLSIVYRNANGEPDQYLVTDAAVNGEYVTFSWLLSEKVVKYKGAVQFRFDADTAAGPAWGTTMAQGESLEGMEPEIDTVEEQTSDVVTQLRAMVAQQTTNVEATGAAQVAAVKAQGTASTQEAVAAIQAQGAATNASIPAEYTELEATVDRLTRDRAAAIVCQAEGELLQITDASNDPLQGLRIFGKSTQDGTPTPDNPVEIVSLAAPVVRVCGKNLLPFPYKEGTVTKNGVTFTVQDDGSIHLKGTATKPANFSVFSGSFPLHGAFTLSGAVNDTTPTTHYLQPYVDGVFQAAQFNAGQTYEINGNLSALTLYVKEGATVDCVVRPQLEAGAESTVYEAPTTQTLAITTPGSLPGIPVASGGNYTDANGQQWIADEVDLARGVYVQRVKKIILDGSNSFTIHKNLDAADKWLYTVYSLGIDTGVDGRGYCDKLQYRTAADMNAAGANTPETAGYSASNSYGVLYINIGYLMAENTVEALRTVLSKNPYTFLAALKTPVETPLTDVELQAYLALHSNKPTTTVLNDAGAHMVLEYAADPKTFICNQIAAAIAAK